MFPISVKRLKKPLFFVLVAAVALPAGSAPVIAHTPLWRLSSFPGAMFSRNWSGYLEAGSNGGYTDVHATWIQPAANCTSGEDSEASFWVGMGGAFAPFVEQIGTESQCSKGDPVYSAWVELFPNPVQRLDLAVHPGDTITADVSFANGVYTLTLTDGTASRTITYSGAGDNTSAEFIAEAPSRCVPGTCKTLPLTDFGSVTFSNASASPDSAMQFQIVMVTNSATPEAVPTDFQNGTFTVNWLRK